MPSITDVSNSQRTRPSRPLHYVGRLVIVLWLIGCTASVFAQQPTPVDTSNDAASSTENNTETDATEANSDQTTERNAIPLTPREFAKALGWYFLALPTEPCFDT